ncbi:MAG TPA: NADH-quinone oxidoreductase subunit NuoH [Gemmatimonadales bacterium]|nr:NADH-quinone oxidoreductase subunit NuoH [Gemmatimonadales bacterium]
MTPEMKGFILLSVLKMLLVFTVVMLGVALLTLMERKVSAWMQNRFGPNRVGPGGLLQPIADGLKNIVKEETYPAEANRVLFLLAPAMAFIPALLLSGVIPFAAPLPLDFDFTLPLLGRFVHQGPMPMVVADVPVGFLFVLAISSLGVYGIGLAGWSSNSKYSLLGGLRACAQLISYEVAMGMSLVPVLLLAGNASFGAIIAEQQAGLWYIGPLFLSFFIFLISGFAETNRLPFDLPEAESELIAGYHTEYSAMKFSLFFIAEYANVVTVSAMVATLFFGGWDIPFVAVGTPKPWAVVTLEPGLVATVLTGLSFFVKTLFWIFFVMWIRWTLPRFRYDQLMALGWKLLTPLALAYILVICTAVYLIERVVGLTDPVARAAALTAVNLVLAIVLFVVIDRGAIVRGSARAARAAQRTAGRAPARAA